MSWITVDDMKDMNGIPCDIFDANGMVIRRAISGFDPVTGKVESFVLDRCGGHVFDQTMNPSRRLETFPAPLIWKKTSLVEAEKSAKLYWDFDGK